MQVPVGAPLGQSADAPGQLPPYQRWQAGQASSVSSLQLDVLGWGTTAQGWLSPTLQQASVAQRAGKKV